MKLSFPLDDVSIEISSRRKHVKSPLYHDDYHCISQDEFTMDVEGVAWFHVQGGRKITVSPCEGADSSAVELYLNGSAYGAVLHQRRIMPMHGSCFRYAGRGVMICGDTGAGKSSLTAAFCLDGAAFLTDDVSPVTLLKGHPFVMSFSDRIKLWGDTLRQLQMKESGLSRVAGERDKYYCTLAREKGAASRLEAVYLLTVSGSPGVSIEEVTGSDKFAVLRNEIYRTEYLQGMPANEALYFRNMIEMSNAVSVYRVSRPAAIPVRELKEAMGRHLG